MRGALAAVLASGAYEQTSGVTPLNGTTNISGTDAGEYCHGYVSAFARDTGNILGPMFIPGALAGASNTYLTDYFYSHRSGISQTGILLAGGDWPAAGKAGVGYLYALSTASDVNSAIGARLEFLG